MPMSVYGFSSSLAKYFGIHEFPLDTETIELISHWERRHDMRTASPFSVRICAAESMSLDLLRAEIGSEAATRKIILSSYPLRTDDGSYSKIEIVTASRDEGFQ
ncbi:hypothetical protein [Solimonas sp. K1W22B-7]|uniref:hypothetical protein n=1 Tax=Solimonas sp. K1W22B-7 TaxID=2303331 RepID=UPI0013C4E684|nr:hypothetical protein [Solimonas sp. K1W22B-7]